VTIVVECPHCESRFNLQPDLAGKSMRCPNGDCREIFTVRAIEAPPAVEEPLVPILEGEAAPAPISERLEPILADDSLKPLPMSSIQDEPLVPILEGEATEPAEPRPRREPKGLKSTKRALDAEAVPEVVAEVVEDKPEGAREANWRKHAPPPRPLEPSTERSRSPRRDDDSEPDFGIKPRRGYGAWMWLLLGLIVAVFGTIVYAVVQQYLNEINKEKMLVEKAEKEFKSQGYVEAKKLYDQLQAEFPSSEEMGKYVFFGKLSDVHTVVSTVIIRENPGEGQKKFEEFLKEYGDSPLAKPTDTGYGYDVFEAGRKIVDAYAENAEWNHKNFLPRRAKRELLDAAEESVDKGRRLIPLVEKYRIKDVKPLDDQRKRFEDLTAIFLRERERLTVIDPYRDLATEPTDQRIAEFFAKLKQHRFETDAEALQLIVGAKAELRRLIRGVAEFRPPMDVPADTAGGLLFVSSPLGQSTLPVIVPPDAVPEVFFATARGILYAFDPPSGNLLWAARVGRSIADLPARVPERPGMPELVLVPVERDGFGIAARVARTGEPKWYQPLEAAIAGRPIVVNNRVYLPLRDELGTVVEIETATGNRLSRIQLRQRIGPGGVRQPGTGTIFVAAEARRVFAIQTEPYDAEGNRQPVRCVQVLSTDHPDLSLKIPPVITGPAGEAKANRYLILAQSDGTQTSRLRGFPITPAEPFDPAVGPPEIAPPLAGSVSLSGHIVFPPHTDGERVAVVTDSGAFGLFGTNQPGNLDANIFAIPSVPLPTDAKRPIAGQVISGEEDTFWALSRGNLHRLRLGVSPQAGMMVNTAGLPLPAGIPVQVPQLNLTREIAFVVVRSDDSDGIRAVAFDPRDGRSRWQRKLGLAPPAKPFPIGATASLLADEDAGVYAVPNTSFEGLSRNTSPVQPAWVLAPPTAEPLAPAKACASEDGQTVWVLVVERGEKDSFRLRVRRVAAGKAQSDELVQVVDKLAGMPVACGNGVVFPCADGFLYRFEPGAAKLFQGPMWRGEGVAAGEPCHVSAFSNGEFVTTDGGTRVTRWKWSAAVDWKSVAGPWTLREKIPFAPLLVEIGPSERRLFVADPAGNVWMYDGDAVGEPVRRWRTSKDDPENAIPAGRPTTGFLVGKGPAGLVVTYSVENRHLVAVAPGSDKPVWVVRRLGAADTLGIVAHGAAFLVTDIAGGIVAYDQITGERLGSIRSENSDLLPRQPAVPVGNGKTLLTPMLDGSVILLPNPAE
jgi:outer membrane protein assembly factor BamB